MHSLYTLYILFLSQKVSHFFMDFKKSDRFFFFFQNLHHHRDNIRRRHSAIRMPILNCSERYAEAFGKRRLAISVFLANVFDRVFHALTLFFSRPYLNGFFCKYRAKIIRGHLGGESLLHEARNGVIKCILIHNIQLSAQIFRDAFVGVIGIFHF